MAELRVLPPGRVVDVARSLVNAQSVLREVEPRQAAAAVGWKLRKLLDWEATLDTGVEVGEGYGSFSVADGRVSEIYAALGDTVHGGAWEDEQQRAALRSSAVALSTEYGTPRGRRPDPRPEYSWRLPEVTLLLTLGGGSLGLLLRRNDDDDGIAAADAAEREFLGDDEYDPT
jgi:Family of unknown function (DUF6301)